jgi:hypothetical protein
MKVALLTAVTVAGMSLSSSVYACGFGLTKFVCCSSASAFPNSPETRYASGCAISRADAQTRCVINGNPNMTTRLGWNESQCRAGSGQPSAPKADGHACTVARRGSNTFTYYSFETGSNLMSKDALCARARAANTTGRDVTHTWYTTFFTNKTLKAVAECENGTWSAYGRGIESIKEVSEKRKAAGGKGCLYKVIKD